MNTKMKKMLQNSVQLLFLVLFSILIMKGKVQIWIGIFLASMLLGMFFGRFYCGWLCPINTVLRAITKIKANLGIKSLHIPSFLKSRYIKYGFLAAFIAAFIYVMNTGKKLPVLPSLLIVGAAITALFSESLWHRNLCPYGTILSLTSKKAVKSLKIASDKCINCGICMKVCPADAVVKEKTHGIDKSLCLLCMDCIYKCPKKAIEFK